MLGRYYSGTTRRVMQLLQDVEKDLVNMNASLLVDFSSKKSNKYNSWDLT
jgi:hypothetical protein